MKKPISPALMNSLRWLPLTLVAGVVLTTNTIMKMQYDSPKKIKIPLTMNYIPTEYAEAPLTSLKYKAEWCARQASCMVVVEALYHESRGEDEHGNVAVAQVIKARLDSDHPWFKKMDTFRKVVYHPYQFSYIYDSSVDKRLRNHYQVQRLQGLAFDVMNDRIDDITHGSTHYHNNTVKPSWSRKLEYTVTVGNHIFYKIPDSNT